MSAERELYRALTAPLNTVAREASNRWRGILEADEIKSEIWIQVLQSTANASDVLNAKEENLIKLLTTKANSICAKEASALSHFSGQYHYSVDEVKEMASDVLTKQGPATCQVIDFMDAVQLMITHHPGRADYILRRYADGEMFEGATDRKRLSRAVEKLTDLMNMNRRRVEAEYGQGPGTRQKIPGSYDPYEGAWDSEFTLHAQGGHSAGG